MTETSETLRALRKDLQDMDRLVPDEYALLDAHADQWEMERKTAMEAYNLQLRRIETLEGELARLAPAGDADRLPPPPEPSETPYGWGKEFKPWWIPSWLWGE